MSGVRIEDGWLDVGGGSLAVTWYRPGAGRADHPTDPPLIVVVVLGIGMDDRVEALGVPPLAERLAARGVPTLVVHPQGTGQSSGSLEDPAVVDRWPADVHTAVAHAVEGSPDAAVVVIAIRTGALGVLLAPLPPSVRGVVLWQPVLDGRRYGRELSLLSTAGSEPAATPHLGAFAIGVEFLRCLGECSVRNVSHRLAAPVLLLADGSPADQRSIDHLRGLVPSLELVSAPDIAAWLGVSSELARSPRQAIGQLIAWVVRPPICPTRTISGPELQGPVPERPAPEPEGLPGLSARRRVVCDDTELHESFVEVGAVRMSGVLSEPVPSADRSDLAVVLLSATGPGRSFVDLAAQLAARGHVVLRVDLSSFGSSGRHLRQGRGELYAHGAADDVQAIVRWLTERGHRHVVLVGFCATGWLAVRAATDLDVTCVIAINAPLYAPGPPWRTIDGVHGPRGWRLLDRINRDARVDRVRERVRRRILPAPGIRHLVRASRADTRVVLAFDEHDLGLAHLRGRVGAVRLPGVEVHTYPALGHTLDGVRARGPLYADVVGWVSG